MTSASTQKSQLEEKQSHKDRERKNGGSATPLLDEIVNASYPSEKTRPPAPAAHELEKREVQLAIQGRNGAINLLQQNYAAVLPVINSVAAKKLLISKSTIAAIDSTIAKINNLLSKQVSPILHNPRFQRLEASWRGLDYLVKQTRPRPSMRLKVLNARRHELVQDFADHPWTSSALYRKVYEEGLDQAGGIPYSALLGDYEFGREDVGLLKSICAVAAAAHAPFIAAAGPKLFNLDTFERFHDQIHDKRKALSMRFDPERFPEWASFRSSPDARFCVLTMPRILMRLPYGVGDQTVHGLPFDEAVDGKKHAHYLWGSSGFALASRLISAFDSTGWYARISGMTSGGVVEGLPVHRHSAGVTYGVETIWPDGREAELAALGFAALVGVKGSSEPVYYGVPTAFDPTTVKTSRDPNIKASHELSAALPYILIASRFAHYLKVILRQKIGSQTSGEELQADLQAWINQYANAAPTAGRELMATRPLREAKVTITPNKARPGVYQAAVQLVPHFQLKEIHVQLSLVAELPNTK